MVNRTLILASASPRRRAILARFALPFTVCQTSAREICLQEDPVRTVAANAAAKAEACRADHPDAWIIAADTLVWFRGHLLGKPRDREEAASFLRAFSGKTQTVYTGLALVAPGERCACRIEASSLTFRLLGEEDIQRYIDRVNPLDRAGAYDINERGEWLIESFHGSYSNIMGLPSGPVHDWLVSQGFTPAPAGEEPRF